MARKPVHAETVLEGIAKAIVGAAAYNRDDVVAPAAVLWTDKERQWEALIPRLRDVLPQLLTLGDYAPADRTGPAIWIRCMIARTLPQAAWAEDVVPIIYLPGVSRQELRAVEDAPKLLQPLAELQFRGVLWTQTNARDWTIAAFLQTEHGGLGLDVARDAATLEAMSRAIVKLADVPIEQLKGKRLEAEDFDELMTPDANRELLAWMNDPKVWKSKRDAAGWASFRGICKEKYEFDCEKDGEVHAAEMMGMAAGGSGAWASLWQRYEESPRLYPNVMDLLRRAKPSIGDGLFAGPSRAWPQDNESQEAQLRTDLTKTASAPPAQVVERLSELEKTHSPRRGWMWAQLGLSPLATALEHLAALAQATKKTIGGDTPESMAAQYIAGGWHADVAALDALASVQEAKDVEAVSEVIKAVYRTWLENTAEHFQKVVKEHPLPTRAQQPEQTARAGSCILFADGLRFDVAQKLMKRLADKGAAAELGHRWSALPPVTPTAKPAVSPVASLINGDSGGDEFRPNVAESGKELTPDRFRQLLDGASCQVLDQHQTGDSSKPAWSEFGSIDNYGHKQGWKLAWRVQEEVVALCARVIALLEAGWDEVRIVTDHGWLLLPGGLPKIDMPKFLTATRWGRCASLAEGANVSVQTVPWEWNPAVHVAVAPGINCFKAGTEYAHGSLSLQECLIPVITVRAGAAAQNVTIKSVLWRRLVCKVTLEGQFAGCSVDVREKSADPESSMADQKQPRPIDVDGGATIYADDSYQGSATTLVVIAPDGRVLKKQPTTVGG